MTAVGAATRAFGWAAAAARAVGRVVLVFMVVTICYDTLMRYVFAAPTSWSLEVNSFLIVFVAVMIAADAQFANDHIRISFFIDRAGGRFKRLAAASTGLVGVVFCGVMTWRGFLLAAQAWEYNERVSSSFGTPMVLPYAMLPIGFGAMTLGFLIQIAQATLGPDEDAAPKS